MASLSPKTLLADLGLSVSAVPPARRTFSAQARPTKGWLVELVGPSGVGKTTLRKEVAARLQKDWFFEPHAKGLLGQTQTDAATEAYLSRLFMARLQKLHTLGLPLERQAEISQRVCEVVRLGLVSKSEGLPRGFFMDDGLLHFFAEQILAEKTDETRAFLERTAFIFLFPDAAQASPETSEQLAVYRAICDRVQSLGRPVLVLDRAGRDENPQKLVDFLTQTLP